MIFKILIRYILGYVNISVEGYYIERFINICIGSGIFLWNVKIKRATNAYANVGLKDFKKLREIAKKTKCKVKIEAKRGMPFLLNRYKKRKIFFLLLAIITVLIYLTSKFVWNIEIKGNNRIEQDIILEELAECGLRIGSKKDRINTVDIVNKIRLKREDIAWMRIDMRGTNVIVQIAETTEKPEIIKQDEYCNIVSDKDAQIVKITANNGTKIVKEGDIVSKGNILIGGWMEGKYTGTRYVHASRRNYSKSLV